jgi:hypothetical protein
MLTPDLLCAPRWRAREKDRPLLFALHAARHSLGLMNAVFDHRKSKTDAMLVLNASGTSRENLTNSRGSPALRLVETSGLHTKMSR